MPVDLVGGSALCCQCCGIINHVDEACQALGMLFHTSCFVCSCCCRELKDQTFYKDQGKLYCEDDYLYCGFQQGSERCHICGHIITSKILRALDRSYHIECFRCTVCNECLDGVPFTLDNDGKVYCVRDYYSIHTNPCAICNQPFVPNAKDEVSIKSVIALGKEFHCECFVCEECNINLTLTGTVSDEADLSSTVGLFCPKYDSLGQVHLYCRRCLMMATNRDKSRIHHSNTLNQSNPSSASGSTSSLSSQNNIRSHLYHTR